MQGIQCHNEFALAPALDPIFEDFDVGDIVLEDEEQVGPDCSLYELDDSQPLPASIYESDMTSFAEVMSTSVVTIQYSSIGHTGGTVPASQSLTTPGSINLRPVGTLTRTGHTFTFLINGQSVNTNSFTINQSHFTAGHQYRISVNVIVSGQTTQIQRTFFIQTPFFAFYGGLGWRYPLNNINSRHIAADGGYKLSLTRVHSGIDIVRTTPGAIAGEAVYAAHSGFAEIAQWSSCAGYWVAIRSDVIDPATNARIVSRYLHFNQSPSVAAGTTVTQGTLIGFVGNTGESTGAHLHLDFNNRNFLDNMNNASINPQRFFPNIIFTGAVSSVMP